MILNVDLITKNKTITRDVDITHTVIGGWTGRDKASLQAHIDELGELGIPAPDNTPMFYAFSAARLTLEDRIEVIGDGSSGEVEFAMLMHDGQLWVTVGSDHTDRVFETYGITLAKQLCDKPIGREFWAMEDLMDHWDQLVLRAYIRENGERVLYQETTTESMLSPEELIGEYAKIGGDMTEGTFMFGGTGPAIGGVRWATSFDMELYDPILNRSLSHKYDVIPMPIRG